MNHKYRGTSHGLFIDTYLAFAWRNWEKQCEISVKIGSSFAKFESYTRQICCYCSGLFSNTFSHGDYTTTIITPKCEVSLGFYWFFKFFSIVVSSLELYIIKWESGHSSKTISQPERLIKEYQKHQQIFLPITSQKSCSLFIIHMYRWTQYV
jgi:hypothetical protein